MKQHLRSILRHLFAQFAGLDRPQKRVISVFSDFFFILFSLWAAFSLRYETFFMVDTTGYAALFGITAITTIFLFARLGLYRAVIRYLSERALITVLAGVAGSALLLIATAFLFRVDIPRSVPVLYGVSVCARCSTGHAT